MILPGSSWCDLVKHAGGVVEFVYLASTRVVCADAVMLRPRWAVEAGQALLYLRAAADGAGRVCAIGQGHSDGQAWVTIDGGTPFSLGVTFGVFPVLLFGTDDGWTVFVQVAADRMRAVRVFGDGRLGFNEIATTVVPTSQGFLYVSHGGAPITQDAGRHPIFGLALPSPSPDGEVWVGQSMEIESLALFDGQTGEISLLNTPGGQPPHIVESGGTFYVCSYVKGGAWLSTHRRPFPVATPQPGPVEDISGQPVDLWAYILPPPGVFPRTSHLDGHGHEMHCVFDGRNFWTLPFGEPDHWVRMVVEGDTLTFREDRSRDGQSTGDYSFTKGLWARRVMRVGDRIVNAENHLVRYQPDGCRVVDVHAFPFRTGLWKRWTSFDCGGDLGWQDVIAYLYDPGGLGDTYELSYFAKGYGFFRWEEYDQRTNALRHWTTFNQFGGRAPQPTPGCWKREHLSLTPTTPTDPPDEDGMTKSELLGVTIHPAFVLGAWTRFIQEALLGRDIIDGTTREDNLTDTVGTRGAAMYFFPTYYAETMKAIDRLGHVPRNDAEWGGVSIAGFEAAKALYRRDQAGGPVVVDPPVDPPPVGPLPPSDLDRIDGQLQIEANGGFHVNGRAVLPTLCHYGDALSKWMRDRDHVLRNLDLISGAGYHGIRYWTALDGDWWNGRHVGENFQSDYWDQHRAFLLELKARGLVAQISQGSLTRDAVPDRTAFANRMADLLSNVGPEVCALFEGVNEARDTGEPDAGRLAEFVNVFHGRLPQVLCALSAYTGTEDIVVLNDFSRAPADLFVVHPYRGGGNHDKTRHLMSLRYEGKPAKRIGWNGEGPGPGHRVSAIDNRDAMTGDTMCGLAAMSFMMRMAYVWFSGVGVISDDGGSQTFDQMPGFFEVPKVRALVPADVMRYSGPIFHGGETWRAQRTFAAQGDVRADHVVHADGRQVIGIYGPGNLNVPQEKGFNAAVDHRFGSEFRLVAGRLQ